MSSTNTSSITSEDHPLLYNTDTQPKKKLNCCDVWNEFRNNSDLIAAMTILVIDIMFFVGIWFPNHIPKLVTSVSYTSLSFIGLLSYPFMLMALYKKYGDIYLSVKHKNCLISTWNIFLFLIIIEGLISIMVYLVAGLMLIFKYDTGAHIIFNIYKPIGIVYIFVNLFKSITTFILNWVVAKKLKEIENNNPQLLVMYHLYMYTDIGNEDVTLGLLARSNMDPSSWLCLQKELKQKEETYDIEKFIYTNLLKNVNIQKHMAILNLVLNILGDISMGICKIWPYSKVQGTIMIIIAVLYDIRLGIKKTLQCIQRCKMNDSDDTVS